MSISQLKGRIAMRPYSRYEFPLALGRFAELDRIADQVAPFRP